MPATTVSPAARSTEVRDPRDRTYANAFAAVGSLLGPLVVAATMSLADNPTVLEGTGLLTLLLAAMGGGAFVGGTLGLLMRRPLPEDLR